MNNRVLPVGNHYGTVEELMAQLPAGGGAAPSIDAYGIPAIGTPENAQMAQMMAPSSTVQLDPEEMEAYKWQNWATAQGFEAMGPRAQREMANMYHTNVLPYVASSLGQDSASLQNEFVTNYPQVGRLIGIEPTETQRRYEDVQEYGEGLTDAQRNQTIFDLPGTSGAATNKMEQDMLAREAMVDRLRERGLLAGVSDDAIAQHILTGEADFLKTSSTGGTATSEETEKRRQMLEEAGGADQFEPQQIAAFIATGHQSHLSPSATATARKNNAEILQKTENFVRTAQSALDTTRADIANIDRALEMLGTDDSGNYAERDTIFPITGPLGTLVGSMPLNTDQASFREIMETPKALAAFAALKDLRESSADGSSGLGQVTEREISLLQSTITNMGDRLGDEELHKSLIKLKEHLQKIEASLDGDVKKRQQLVDDGLLWTAIPGAPRYPVPTGPAPTGAASTPAPADAGTPAPAPTDAATSAPAAPIRMRYDIDGNLIE